MHVLVHVHEKLTTHAYKELLIGLTLQVVPTNIRMIHARETLNKRII